MRFGALIGLVGEDGDVAVWVKAVDEAGAGRPTGWESLGTDWNAAVGSDSDGSTLAPDVRPPRAAGHRTENGTAFTKRSLGGGVRGHRDLAVTFGTVAMLTEILEQRVGGLRGDDLLCGEEAGEAALPVEVEALDFALGLGRMGIAEADAVEVERGSELGEGVRVLGKEEAVAIDIKFEREAMLTKGGRKEVEVGEEIFRVVQAGTGAEPGAIVDEVQERIKASVVVKEPRVWRGIELPEGTEFEGLPAASGGFGAWPRDIMGEAVGEGPATNARRIDLKLKAAKKLRGDEAIGGGRPGAEELAGERDDRLGPHARTIAAGETGGPLRGGVGGASAQEVGVELVEAGAADAEALSGKGGREAALAEGGEYLADQGSAEAASKLAIMLFTAERLIVPGDEVDGRALAQRAFRRPTLRSGLLHARWAKGVRL